ncbi:MAG: oligosaccharide flippase family protein [Gammaproteobacteria bacterium]|nr:oligosaccharide flippase family protein [Gammaproteobacteria bacterium]
MIKSFYSAFGVRMAGIAAGFGLHFLLTHIMMPDQYGIYVYLFSWVMFASVIARLGFDNYLIKKIPEYLTKNKFYAAKNLISFSIATSFSLALLIAVAFLTYSLIYNSDQQYFWTTITAAFLLFPVLVAAYLNQSALLALKKIVISNIPIAIARPIIMSTGCLATFLIIGIDLSARTVMQANAFAFALAAATLSWLVTYHLPSPATTKTKKSLVDTESRIGWLKEASPYTLYAGTSFLNRRVDILLLGMFSTATSVGIYNIVASLITVVSLATVVAQQMSKPIIAEAYSNNNLKKMHAFALKSGALGFLLTSAFVLVFLLFGNQILNLFGNINNSPEAYTALLILLLGKLTRSLLGLPGIVLLFTKHQKLSSNLEILTVAASTGVGYILVIKYGLIGAAISTSMVLVARTTINHLYARRHFGLDFSIINNIPYFYSLLKLRLTTK